MVTKTRFNLTMDAKMKQGIIELAMIEKKTTSDCIMDLVKIGLEHRSESVNCAL